MPSIECRVQMRQAWEAVHPAYRCPYQTDIDLVAAGSDLVSQRPYLIGIYPACRPLCLIDIFCHLLVVPGFQNRDHRWTGVPLTEGPSSKINPVSLLLSRVNVSLWSQGVPEGRLNSWIVLFE